MPHKALQLARDPTTALALHLRGGYTSHHPAFESGQLSFGVQLLKDEGRIAALDTLAAQFGARVS
ncbi:MAG TPA: hypothetical protein PJ982_10840 [Lacipirellulaceae bacterium]|nr:hypothetical protein [Lacipirellulaceae bacterium]